ncbi:hypothetical protein VI817_003043 [Penicillium citrinum]|nr:hypothetical protein VI817_003043 [Penicillium citrinum]
MSRLTQCLVQVRTKAFAKFAIVAFFLFLLGFSIRYIHNTQFIGEYLDPAEERQIEVFDFSETEDEKRCFDSVAPGPNPIPKIVHFIWLDNPELNFMTYLTIRSAIVSIRPERINLHYTSLNETNPWFLELRDHLYLVPHDLEKEYPKQLEEKWGTKRISDILRLDTIDKEGGIYLDMDVIALRPFDNLLNSKTDAVLGHQGADRNAVSNAIIVGRRGSKFIKRWRASYGNFSSNEEDYYAIVLPKKLSLDHPSDICVLSPVAFFWPTWTERHIKYMHQRLSKPEAKEFAKVVMWHNGRLRQNQLAYHGWSQAASSQLSELDEESIKRDETRFNILARRFLL